MKEIRYCPKCGKEIDADSVFCTHCGFTLNSSIKTSIWSKMKNNQRIGIVITGLWMLVHLCFFVSDPLEEGYNDETLWFFDSKFSEFYAYGLGEFMFYGVLVPALVWGVVYIFTKNKKVGWLLTAGLSASVFVFWGTNKYDEYKNEQEIVKQKELQEKLENAPIINREFISCTFGDSYSSVLQKVKKEYRECIVDSLSDMESIVLSNVSYGSRIYDRMGFDFYKGKLYQVYFRKTYDTEKDKENAYKHFQEILEQKNYPHDSEKYSKYYNSSYYLDKHTELKLRHSIYEYDGYDQYVQLVYYDLNSHQKDEGL